MMIIQVRYENDLPSKREQNGNGGRFRTDESFMTSWKEEVLRAFVEILLCVDMNKYMNKSSPLT